MKRFAWGWLLCLTLAPVPGALPEASSWTEEAEESERHVERGTTAKLRKRIVRRPAVSPAPRPPRGVVAVVDLAPEPLALWISRTHQRSPTS